MAIYLFFDESGNLDFSDSGTEHYLFGVLSTHDPAPLNNALTALRYELLSEEFVLEQFHAAEDRQMVRDRVFETLLEVGGFTYDAVVVKKRKTHPSLHDSLKFYPKFAEILLQYVFARHGSDGDPLILITDRLPLQKKRKALEKAFRLFLSRRPDGRRYVIGHHPSVAHPCLQAADYLNWALYRKWEKGDARSYDPLRLYIKSELDVFEKGSEYFY